jgi:hypothetical protein
MRASPKCNAVQHRELIDPSAPRSIHINPASVIATPVEAQKRGARISGGWLIMDSDGNRSNEVRYSVHCNGG